MLHASDAANLWLRFTYIAALEQREAHCDGLALADDLVDYALTSAETVEARKAREQAYMWSNVERSPSSCLRCNSRCQSPIRSCLFF